VGKAQSSLPTRHDTGWVFSFARKDENMQSGLLNGNEKDRRREFRKTTGEIMTAATLNPLQPCFASTMSRPTSPPKPRKDDSLHEWIGDGWAVLFYIRKDFTRYAPRARHLAGLEPEFKKRNTKIIGLSVDPVSSTASGRPTSRRRRAQS